MTMRDARTQSSLPQRARRGPERRDEIRARKESPSLDKQTRPLLFLTQRSLGWLPGLSRELSGSFQNRNEEDS